MAMAFTHKMSSTKLILIVVFVAFMPSKADLVDRVCNLSDYCKTTLHSDPNWETADVYGMGLIAVGIAQQRAKDMMDLLANLKLGADQSPHVQGIYDSCINSYGSARNELLNAIDHFHRKLFNSVKNRANAAYYASNACDASFYQDPEGTKEPPIIETAAVEFRDLYYAISSLAQQLLGSEQTPREGLIDDVCNHTQLDPGFCKTALSSDLRSQDANLWTLAQIGINSAQSYAKSTISLLQSLQQNATDPEPKREYDACLGNYATVSNELINCLTALRNLDTQTLNQHAQAAYVASDVCDSQFREPPAPEVEDLKTAGLHIKTLCSLISYMSTKLGVY